MVLFASSLRRRVNQRRHGVVAEPLVSFAFRNAVIAAALFGFTYQMSSYRGPWAVPSSNRCSATPKGGLSFELDVIAACFIGGASASGGVGKITGVVIGAFIMGVMNNGMSILGLGIDYQQVIKGIVLLAAVCVDVYNKNK